MFDQIIAVEGRLGGDPELRFSPSGVAVGSFSLAHTERRKVNDQWQDGDTTWFRVTCFRDMAEHVVDSLSKGDLAIVIGKFKLEEWTSQEGVTRQTAAIVADSIGPSLKFRSTPHGGGGGTQRAERSASRDEGDPWASGGSQQGGQASQPEDPPF